MSLSVEGLGLDQIPRVDVVRPLYFPIWAV